MLVQHLGSQSASQLSEGKRWRSISICLFGVFFFKQKERKSASKDVSAYGKPPPAFCTFLVAKANIYHDGCSRDDTVGGK